MRREVYACDICGQDKEVRHFVEEDFIADICIHCLIVLVRSKIKDRPFCKACQSTGQVQTLQLGTPYDGSEWLISKCGACCAK